MTAEDRNEPRLERIVEVYESPDGSDSRVPTPTRTLGAAAVTVTVVAAILLDAPVLAGGLLLVALAVAVGTAIDRSGRERGSLRESGDGSGHLAAIRARLAELRSGSGSSSG